MMGRRLDNLDLENLEASAKCGWSHPLDILKLVEEVRLLRAEMLQAADRIHKQSDLLSRKAERT